MIKRKTKKPWQRAKEYGFRQFPVSATDESMMRVMHRSAARVGWLAGYAAAKREAVKRG